ncbi:MAG TPA: type II toxin-antitoxin system VapC family toxin [Rhizomicrobium sp.]|nr:type II toxin-antitoxin system VapC family toxin [Rhizomicrobium sp.]
MSAHFLLDTCAAIYIGDNEWLKPQAIEAIDTSSDQGRPVYLSPITAWEIGLLAKKGRFKSSLTPRRWLDRLLSFREIALCELTSEVLLESSFLPGDLHRDPADRIIAATAREYGYTVITRDRALLDYAAAGHLRALEC